MALFPSEKTPLKEHFFSHSILCFDYSFNNSAKWKVSSISFKDHEKKDLIAHLEKLIVLKTAFAKEHNIPKTTLNDIIS